MDLNKVANSLTEAITELRTEPNPNAAIGMATTEAVAALRIVKAQAALPPVPAAAPETAAKK
jgi:hypothetical protein